MRFSKFVWPFLAGAVLACTGCSTDAKDIMHEVLDAMSGHQALKDLESFAFVSSSIYRSQTLTQSYNLKYTDQSVAAAGSQTIFFRWNSSTLQARIDRTYQYADYWIWAFPGLSPAINYSMVLEDGPYGYACFNMGQNSFFSPDPRTALGFADGYLTDYLVNEAHQYALPWLLQQFMAAPAALRVSNVTDGTSVADLLSVEHRGLGLSLILNSTSRLPHMVRTRELDPIFGKTTSDMVFTNYSSVSMPDGESSILLPHRVQTVYDSVNVVEDFVVDQILLNSNMSTNFFDPDTSIKSQNPRTPPTRSNYYSRAEVHELYEAGLWGGPFGEEFTVANVTIEHPLQNATAIKSVYVGYPDYVQLLVEIGDNIVITDAAPYRSKIIIDWVRQNMNGKHITHVVPSHHHRDHAGGIADYVSAGAKVVVPEIARDFYNHINNGTAAFVTYNETHPFELHDQHWQFQSFWSDENPHARDWSYAVVSSAHDGSGRQTVVFNADVVSPGFDPTTPRSEAVRWDTAYARQWLTRAAQDGVPRSSMVLGAHGSTYKNGVSNAMGLQEVLDITGFDYPKL